MRKVRRSDRRMVVPVLSCFLHSIIGMAMCTRTCSSFVLSAMPKSPSSIPGQQAHQTQLLHHSQRRRSHCTSTLPPSRREGSSTHLSAKPRRQDSPTTPSTATSSSNSNDSSNKRKKKKNKYAKFSKATDEVDPFEKLVQDSTQKLQQIENEQIESSKPAQYDIPDGRLDFPNILEINPYDPATFGYVEIGTITGPHGVHGWTKVKGSTDFPERLTTPGMLLHIKALHKRAPRKAILTQGKQIGDDFLIQLQGVFDRPEAQRLRGATLYYATQEDEVVEEDEVLISDMVGLYVYHVDDTSISVGMVDGIVLASEMCAVPGLGHDFLELKLLHRPKEDANLVLIPNVPEIIKHIDMDKRQIVIDPPSGLLDLAYVREEKVKIKAYLPSWTEESETKLRCTTDL